MKLGSSLRLTGLLCVCVAFSRPATSSPFGSLTSGAIVDGYPPPPGSRAVEPVYRTVVPAQVLRSTGLLLCGTYPGVWLQFGCPKTGPPNCVLPLHATDAFDRPQGVLGSIAMPFCPP